VPPTRPARKDPTRLGEAEITLLTTPCWLNRGGWLAKVGVVAVGSEEKDIQSKIFLGLLSSLLDSGGPTAQTIF